MARDLRSVRRSWLIVTIAVVWTGLSLGAIAGEDLRSEEITAVELRTDSRTLDADILWSLLEISTGQDLDADAIRRTLKNLHAVESVGRAEVRAIREPGGLRIVVVVESKLLVRAIRLSDDLCIRRSRLLNRLEQAAGTPLSESRLVRGVYRLEETLFDSGYRDASVRLDVSVNEAEMQADVVYDVDCGSPTVVTGVSFDGDLGPLTAEDLRARLRVTEGQRLETSLLDGEKDRLQTWLVEEGYRLARVDGPDQKLKSESGGMILRYAVEVGPRVDIAVEGADRDRLERRGGLGLLNRERFDEALVITVVEKIRRFYQEQGYYDVDVRWETYEDEDPRRLEIDVRQGPRYSVGSLTFDGNEAIPDQALAAGMATSVSEGLGGGGRLVDEVLDDDLENLEAYYARQGFGSAQIGPAEIVRRDARLEVRIPVREGPKARLVSLDFVGVESADVAENLSGLPLVPGGPFHPRLLEETLDEVRALYEDAGHLWAQVEGEVGSGIDPTLKNVVIRVLEGPQVEVERVLLRGVARTRRELVLRSLGIERGDPVSRSVLLDGQRRLYRLGVFSLVEVELAAGMPFASRRDVLVRVREGRSQRVTYGLGYDSEDGLRTLLGYSHSNVARRAVSVRVDFRLSQREELYRALLRQPVIGRWDVPVTYSLFRVEEDKESFGSRRRGAQVEGHRFWGSSRVGLLLTYKFVDVLERPDVPLFTLGIDRNLQDAEIASLTPSLQLDYRDDPLIPTQGWTLNLQGELALPVLSAEAEYRKLFSQYARYVPLGRFGVAVGSARLGAIDPKGGRALDSSLQVPISEQFFAGGRTTHRAYKRDLLGVLGETILLCNPESGECGGEVPEGEDPENFIRVPVGGNAMILLNVDYRFPIAGPVGGTAFVDVGNVWTEWTDIDPDEVKIGAGIGIRYLSPIGPLRLEVGWKLDREPDEEPAVVFLSFGNPF
jgi:outer membrane protein insertion porin family